MLIQAGSGSPPIALAVGGFAGHLEENQPLPAYTYKVVSPNQYTGLQFFKGLTMWRFQFDCFGATAVVAQTLANAIDRILNGFTGTLPDPDSTWVNVCLQTDRNGPNFSDSARNFWVMLEYEIWFRG